MSKVAITLYGKRVGWAYENYAGKLGIQITDEDALRWITEGLTVGLAIDHDKYGEKN